MCAGSAFGGASAFGAATSTPAASAFGARAAAAPGAGVLVLMLNDGVGLLKGSELQTQRV